MMLCIGAASAADGNDAISGDNNETVIGNGDELLSVENDEVLSADNNDLLSADTKTFADLNATINGNNDSEINLSGNYKYTGSNSDSKFQQGVVINRAVTINGNGCTIDGSNKAGIFKVNNAAVVFKNITFINGRPGDPGNNNYNGGAINGKCLAVNCTFDNNKACRGGAMFQGSAVNCSFNGNYASTAGAMYNGSAVGCTFNKNSAMNSGGAMCLGSAVNCSFTENSVELCGGAVSQVSAVNCTFIKNKVTHYSDSFGIIYGGGGMYLGTAVNCFFKENSAQKAPAALKSNLDTCILVNNVESGCIRYNPTLTVLNYTSGDNLRFDFRAHNKMYIANGNITVKIYKNDTDKTFVGKYTCLSGVGLPIDLDIGSYIAECSATQFNIEVVTVTLDVRYLSDISADNKTVIHGYDDYIIVTLKNRNGTSINNTNVSVDLNGVKNYTTDGNGQFKIPTKDLDVNEYLITITFAGNEMYAPSSAVVNLKVNKDNPQLTLKNLTTVYNSDDKLIITLKDSLGNPIANATLFIYVPINKNYTTNESGQIGMSTVDLIVGDYDVTVTFKENENYTETSAWFGDAIKVVPANVTIGDITVNSMVYGSNNTVSVKGNIASNTECGAVYDDNVTVSIEGFSKSVKVNEDGSFEAVIELTDALNAGDYNVTVNVTGSRNFNANVRTFKNGFTVNKATVAVQSVEPITVVYGDNNTLIVKGKLNSTEYGVNYTGNVTVEVEGMSNSSNVGSDGCFAVVIVSDSVGRLTAGNYSAGVEIWGDDNYNHVGCKSFDNALTVVPATIAVQSVDLIEIVYGENNTLTVTGKVNNTIFGVNYTGNVTVEVESMSNSSNVGSDGIFTVVIVSSDVGKLSAGTYNISVEINGDDNYNHADFSTFNDVLTVVPATIAVQSVDLIEVVYGENNTLTVTGKVNNTKFGVNYTGNVTVDVEGMTNTSQVSSDGTFSVVISDENIGKLDAGKYNVSVSVNGADDYKPVGPKTFENTLTVTPTTIAVQSVDSVVIVYGDNNTLTVTGKVNNTKFGVNYTGNVTVDVEGMFNSSNVDSDGSFTVIIVDDNVGKLTEGKHNISVAIEGDANYNPAGFSSFDDVLTVVPATIAIISVEDISVVYGVNKSITVTGKLNSTKYGNNYSGEISVSIENLVTNTSNALNGQFSVVISGVQFLSVGEYTIKVSGSETENYKGLSEKTALLNITKNQFDIDAGVTGVSEGSVKVDQNATVTIDVSDIPTGEFNTTGKIIVNVSGIDKNYEIEVPVVNNTVKLDIIATPGTYTVNVQYTGNSNYNASEIVSKTFTVTKWNETDLQELIDNSEGNVTLEHDYTYTNENVTVNVTDAVSINAAGHTIDANGSSTAFNITSDNVAVENISIVNVNGTAIESAGGNTTVNNADLENVSATAIKINGDNATLNNITATNTNATLMDVTGDNITITNVNSTDNTTIRVDGKVNKIENITGATVMPTIRATNVVKGSDVIITAVVSATEGNVTVRFNGKNYTEELNDGKAVITIPNVERGTYTDVPVAYEGTDLYQSVSTATSFTSQVNIVGNKDVSIDYLSGYEYTVRIVNADGTYASGVTAKMTVNGVTYKVKTDKNGYAKLLIELKPKTYKITVQYLNVKKTNKITVKSTIFLVKKTVAVKKTAKKFVLQAKLKWSNGKAIKGKVVKFKFKGKVYKAKTNSKGIAKVTVKKSVIKKLKKGKTYKFWAKYTNEYKYGKVNVKE